jgi:hypothetical protein
MMRRLRVLSFASAVCFNLMNKLMFNIGRDA